MWIGMMDAVWQTPGNDIEIGQRRTTDPSANDVPHFVRERHHKPRGD